jgi:hypothetical protein
LNPNFAILNIKVHHTTKYPLISLPTHISELIMVMFAIKYSLCFHRISGSCYLGVFGQNLLDKLSILF